MFRRWHVLPGKKRGLKVGKTKCGKGTMIMLLADGNGLPLAVETHGANRAEVKVIESLVECLPLDKLPRRLVYDKAADSDDLRERLEWFYDIELVTPHRKNRKRPKRQDGRKLRRYKRRWKVERTIAWLKNFRRVLVRYDHCANRFQAWVQLACVFTILQRF